jgi:cell filamentation protein
MADAPYCYPGTNVLINKEDILAADDLEQFERLATAQRLREGLPSVPLTVDGYCELHRHIFQDVYQWAGKFRTVDISKGGHLFCRPAFIAGQMDERFKAIRQGLLQNLTEDEFVARAADHLCELNAIHPFREGNGRTMRAFLEVRRAPCRARDPRRAYRRRSLGRGLARELRLRQQRGYADSGRRHCRTHARRCGTPREAARSGTRPRPVDYLRFEADRLRNEPRVDSSLNRVIALLREGELQESLPSFLKGVPVFDVRDGNFGEEVTQACVMLRSRYLACEVPARVRPDPVGYLGDGLAGYSRRPSAPPSTRTSLFTELAMKQASCDL